LVQFLLIPARTEDADGGKKENAPGGFIGPPPRAFVSDFG
jgi:hypothetical protein